MDDEAIKKSFWERKAKARAEFEKKLAATADKRFQLHHNFKVAKNTAGVEHFMRTFEERNLKPLTTHDDRPAEKLVKGKVKDTRQQNFDRKRNLEKQRNLERGRSM